MAPAQAPHIMQLIHSLAIGGSERLAVTISSSLPEERFQVSVCALFGAEGSLVPELQQLGVPYFSLQGERKSKLRLFLDLFRLLRAQNVRLLQVHGAYPLLYCFLPARLAGVKIVYTEHARQGIQNVLQVRLAATYLARYVARVVCVSQNLGDFFLAHLGHRASRLQVIHNGTDTSRFASDRPPFQSTAVTIGCVARLTEAKDHGNLLKAFARARVGRPGIRLRVIGDGELRGVIEAEIRALGLGEAVEMVGNRSDVPEQLALLDIFVLSSKREGFPVAILEAMAAGRAVVATSVGGVEEVISHGETGLVVRPEDPEALAEALGYLIDHPAEAREIAQRGQERVRSDFDRQQMVVQYRELFDRVMVGTA